MTQVFLLGKKVQFSAVMGIVSTYQVMPHPKTNLVVDIYFLIMNMLATTVAQKHHVDNNQWSTQN